MVADGVELSVPRPLWLLHHPGDLYIVELAQCLEVRARGNTEGAWCLHTSHPGLVPHVRQGALVVRLVLDVG